MKFATAVLIATLALAAPGLAQTVRPVAVKPAAVDAVVSSFPGFSGVVLAARDGKPVFRKAYGLANRELGAPNKVDTKFRIGSNTKAFTAAAIMQLQDAGKLSVDDPVSKHLPNTPEAWAPVTVRHLLTHRSGLQNYLAGIDPSKDMTPDQMIDAVRARPLVSKPGERFAYSNTGYVLLGRIVERVSGQSYADYVRDHIMKPAGMLSSGYDNSAVILPGRAAGYVVRGGEVVNAAYLSMTVPYAAGSLYSTVDDLLKWDQALNNDSLVSAAARAEMFRDQGGNYGFGWQVFPLAGHPGIKHGGDINGFSSHVSRFVQDHVTVIVLSNMQDIRHDVIADNIAALYLGAPPRRPHAGGETTIRNFVAMMKKGEVDMALLTDFAANDVKAQKATLQPLYVRYGELKAVTLLAADAAGFDRYKLVFDNAVLDMRVGFEAGSGKINQLNRREMPRTAGSQAPPP